MTEVEKKDYKTSLNLPQTDLPMRANANVREVEIQSFWEENKIYEKNIAQRNKSKAFILHDGPPYLSSDKIHIGTALNKILKDILIKYKSLSGYYAPYIPGYDAHGLPIENAVVKSIKGGREALTQSELRKLCREFAAKNLKGQEANFRRLGVWGDWEHPYLTIAPDFEAEQVRVFGQMYENGYIYKGLKPVYWCADCETALAEAEVEYDDHTSSSIFVKFRFVQNDEKTAYSKAGISSDLPLYAVIWTTTPWTIPANLAISLNSRFEYSFVKHNNEVYVIATDLLGDFLKDTEIEEENITILGTCTGQDLEKLNTKHPLYDRSSLIILGDHVTLEAGTGCVHTAPGHGLEDYEVAQRYKIPVLSPLDNKGVFTAEAGEFEGLKYTEGNKKVIERLKEENALITERKITHSYPHCWRCKKPVIYRATAQWFVDVGAFRDKAMAEIKKVKWIPKSGEQRIGNMVENRSDWCISRQRAWGVPIPVFYCEDCGEAIVTSETIKKTADLFTVKSSDAWCENSAADILGADFVCPKCQSKSLTKETDIMDVWFDSGVTHKAVVDARKDELLGAPADMYLEGSDQHRGWFQSSLLTSVATKGEAPYKEVLTHGFVLDGEGRKMSKSLGNFVEPQKVINVFGTDVLRLWAASVDYRNDVKIGDNIIKQLVEVFKKVRNTSRFLLGNLYDFDPAKDYVQYEDLKEIDKFALHKLQVLIQNVTQSFNDYEFYKYFQFLQNFAAVDLSAFYLDIVKDRLYTAGKKSLSRRATQTVLYEIMQALIRMLVPVTPHQAEDIWSFVPENQRQGLTSILLSDWCQGSEQWLNNELDDKWSSILKVREITNKAIEPLRADKKAGSSLEVAVYVNTSNQSIKNYLESEKDELSSIFITSQVFLTTPRDVEVLSSYEEDEIKIDVTKAQGEKCERCWKYRELNQNVYHPTLCNDCIEAISG
ncbi:MAG: isoleucine--tRNA ligase [Candidatus Gastranaerophilales bacterium]|nr:isoleucine--tRNA ligase [Candidatus Gastranaerophilales bacterium]